MKWTRWMAVGGLALLAAGEITVRLMGLGDFPLYEANNVIGYIPKASQQGTFMNTNDWEFNSLHMGTGEFKPGPGRDVLLVGDSLVYGGNPYRQAEKIGPSLARHMPVGTQVWPIGAGSWAINNELTWLMQHPDVVAQVEDIVFVLNSGDLIDTGSSWRCDRNHPTQRPASVLWFQAQKKLELEACNQTPDGMAVADRPWREAFKTWLASPQAQGKRLHFVLYPDKGQLLSGQKPALPQTIAQLQELGLTHILDLGSDPAWKPEHYRDAIHPTAEGNDVLGQVIGKWLQAPTP